MDGNALPLFPLPVDLSGTHPVCQAPDGIAHGPAAILAYLLGSCSMDHRRFIGFRPAGLVFGVGYLAESNSASVLSGAIVSPPAGERKQGVGSLLGID